MARKSTQPPDWVIGALTLSLLFFGWVILYSASALVAESRYGDQYFFLKKQMLWSCLGMAALLAALRVKMSFVQRLARPLFVVELVFLVLVLVVGHEVAGGRRWLRLAGFGFQPSEFAKLALVLVLADFLDRKKSRLGEFKSGFLPPMVLVGLVLGLIALERDLGTPMLIAMVSLGLIYLAGARYRHLLALVLAGLPVVYYAIFSVAYRRERFFTFLDPWKNPQGTSYQLVQSLLAIGSGGFWGRGSGESTIKMYYLPEAQTDFVFSILGEELGFVGASLLVLLFLLLVLRCYQVAIKASNWFETLVAAGISLMLGGQVLINLGVVTGLLPTKGIPLPFVSFGGSSLLVTMAAIGLVLNISRRAGEGVALQRRQLL
ncbi:MAG TPA: putative lipid II flippase FtsW [Elusimicrobiota bacterium]|nr:putative lipid II flippase FtsW [Elusimicrobiota bacterium]